MKVLSLAFSVLAFAIAFATAIVPANAQGAWTIASVTYDPTKSGASVAQVGNASATYSISTQNMEVSQTSYGSSPANGPSYLARVLATGTYDANFEWSGGGSPDTQFTFTISGESDGNNAKSYGSSNCLSNGGDSEYSVGGLETPIEVGSWDDSFPPDTEQTVTLGSPTPSSYTIVFTLTANGSASGGGTNEASSSSAYSHVVVDLSI